MHLGTADGNLTEAIRRAIADRIDDAVIEVSGGRGHFSIRVTSAHFHGKTPVQRQRMVLGAIAHLMQGDPAPVHAVDRLQTLEP